MASTCGFTLCFVILKHLGVEMSCKNSTKTRFEILYQVTLNFSVHFFSLRCSICYLKKNKSVCYSG